MKSVHVVSASKLQRKDHRNTSTMCLAVEPFVETLALACLLSGIPGVVTSGNDCVVTQEAGVSVIAEGDHEIVMTV